MNTKFNSCFIDRVEHALPPKYAQYRDLRTLFDCASDEWRHTTADQKLDMLAILAKSEGSVSAVVLAYQDYQLSLGHQARVQQAFFGIIELLDLFVSKRHKRNGESYEG